MRVGLHLGASGAYPWLSGATVPPVAPTPTPTPTPAPTPAPAGGLAFPAPGARYDLDWAAGRYFAAAPIPSNAAVMPGQPDGSNSNDGRFFRQLISPSNPRYTEQADGSLRRETATGTLRRTSRGLWVFPRSQSGDNPILWSSDLTQAGWIKTGVTASLTQTTRDGIANKGTLLTATAAGGTALFPTAAAAASRSLWADIRRVSGTGTVELTRDGGATWTAIVLDRPRFDGWGRYGLAPAPLVANPGFGFRLGTAGDQIGLAFVQSDLFAFEAPPLEQVGAARIQWNDRPSTSTQGGSTTSVSSGLMDHIAGGQPWGVFVEWVTQKADSFMFGQIVRPNADGSITASDNDGGRVLSTGPGSHRVTTDMTAPLINRALFFVDTANGVARLSANGSAVVTGTGYGAYTTLDHKDLGSNGAGGANMAGYITRLAIFSAPPTDAEMRGWTAVA